MADLDVSIKKINDLTAQAEAGDDDLLAVGNNETGLLKKITVKNHAESIKNTIIGESEEIADIADGTVVGAIKQFDSDIPETQGIVTDAFDETKTYSAGDYCIYNNTLYKFKEEKTAGEWDDDPELVEAVTVMGELNSALADLKLGYGSTTGNTVTMDGYRATDTFTYPSSMTSHTFACAIAVNSGNGYIQGTIQALYSNSCFVVFHDPRGSSTSTFTYTVYYIYFDK